MLFRNKRDRKVINVNPNVKLDENVTRREVYSPDYTQIVLYDHETRKKNSWFCILFLMKCMPEIFKKSNYMKFK